jgi:Zn-dependent M28 family amino/carboxypeptidase
MPATVAPGGDDNASGIAVMLETARLLREAGLDRHILCAAFGGEEQGLYGSRACAQVAAAEGWAIRLVINLDMVGFRDPAHPGRITVEFDQGNAQPGNDAAAKGHAMTMAQAAADYTALEVEHTDIWNSDYMPFEALGYACIGLYDGAADAPFYHSPADTLDKVDLAHLAEVTRLVVATVATIVRPAPADGG